MYNTNNTRKQYPAPIKIDAADSGYKSIVITRPAEIDKFKLIKATDPAKYQLVCRLFGRKEREIDELKNALRTAAERTAAERTAADIKQATADAERTAAANKRRTAAERTAAKQQIDDAAKLWQARLDAIGQTQYPTADGDADLLTVAVKLTYGCLKKYLQAAPPTAAAVLVGLQNDIKRGFVPIIAGGKLSGRVTFADRPADTLGDGVQAVFEVYYKLLEIAGDEPTDAAALDRFLKSTDADGVAPMQHAARHLRRYIYSNGNNRGRGDKNMIFSLSDFTDDDGTQNPARLPSSYDIDSADDFITISAFLDMCKATFTPRQLQIIKYRLRGFSLQEIADKLGVGKTAVFKQLDKIRNAPIIVDYFAKIER